MKKYLNISKFFILSVIFYFVAVFTEKANSGRQALDFDVEKVEAVIHQKEIQLEKYLNDIEQKLKDKNFVYDKPSSKIFFDPDNYQELIKEGFTILIYKEDSLSYWSDNQVELSKTYSNSKFYDRVLITENSVHLISSKTLEDYTILGLIKIKNSYSYRNKYLRNNLLPEINLPDNFDISKIPLSEASDVKDKDGAYIFSLVPSNSVISQKGEMPILTLLYVLSMIFMIIFFAELSKKIVESERSNWWVLAIVVVVILGRFFSLNYKIPQSAYSLPIFDSQYYASSYLFPSLGDMLINSLLIAFFVYVASVLLSEKFAKNFTIKNSSSKKIALTFLLFSFVFGLFIVTYNLLQSLILDSKISFEIYNIQSISILSIYSLLVVVSLIGAFVVFLINVLNFVYRVLQTKQIIATTIISLIIPTLLSFVLKIQPEIFTGIYLLVLLITLVVTKEREYENRYYLLTLIAFISSIYLTLFINKIQLHKNDENKKLIASQLIDTRDPVAEHLVTATKEEIGQDQTISTYISDTLDVRVDKKIKSHLSRKYFTGYLSKYDIEIEICSDLNYDDPNKQILNCQIKYTDDIKKRGAEIEHTGCYYLKNENGSISYTFSENYDIDLDGTMASLYIFLNPKSVPQNIGYPELLLDEKFEKKERKDYSFAKYENDVIVTKSGDYQYPTNGKRIYKSENEFLFFNLKGNRNLVFTYDEGSYIVITYNAVTFWEYVTTFAYIFAILNIIVLLYFLIASKFWVKFFKTKKLYLRAKLILTNFGILTISFIALGAITIFYSSRQFKQRQDEQMQQKLRSIQTMLNSQYVSTNHIYSSWNSEEMSNLDYRLSTISNIFGNDINLYNVKGELIASSRSEIFRRNLISTYINSTAFRELKINSKTQFTHNEKISLLKYSSSYIPLINDKGKTLAYINIPFFSNYEKQQQELTSLIITILNIYAVLFIIALSITIIISEQIILPIRLLQNKFQNLEVGKQYEHLHYQKNDEIGELVNEYNKMVDKLYESIDLLAKSEREEAWRDMAKQVAHEIKNPLTPMKLNIQFLMKSWEKQDEDFGERIQKISNTLISEIENLKRIATDFSEFARMPKPQDEEIDLIEKIENIVQLYENTEGVDITAKIETQNDITVIADQKHLSRVFINLIKNAIQAIPKGIHGKIKVSLKTADNKAIVTIEDNGSGIDDEAKDKLFVPSFTTKSSGMGLGLPMVKNIIQNSKGKIWFETELGKGTKFIIELPTINKTVE